MYQFYIDGELLPVTPKKVTVKIANQNKTLTLINGEEINILKRPGLSKITFTALFPSVQYPFSQYLNGFQEPTHYLNKLEALKNGLKPFFFQIVRTNGGFQSNFTVSLEDYEIVEDAEQYGRDISVDVTMLQYRTYGTKIITFKDNSTASVTNGARDTTGKEETTTYTVKSGDCLWNIAKKYLGDGSRYTEIYNLNKDKIKNPNLIYPNQVLTLPS